MKQARLFFIEIFIMAALWIHDMRHFVKHGHEADVAHKRVLELSAHENGDRISIFEYRGRVQLRLPEGIPIERYFRQRAFVILFVVEVIPRFQDTTFGRTLSFECERLFIFHEAPIHSRV